MPYRSQSITPKMARDRVAGARKRLAAARARAEEAWAELRAIEARLIREELRTDSEVAAAERRHSVAIEWQKSLSRARRKVQPPLDPRKEERRLTSLRRKQETSEVRAARQRAEAADADRRKAADELAAAQSALDTVLAIEGDK